MVSIAAFQAVDPGSIPGQRNEHECEFPFSRPCGFSNGKKKSSNAMSRANWEVFDFFTQSFGAYLFVLQDHVPLKVGTHPISMRWWYSG